jgi:PTS system mannose-specific IIB component
MIAWVRIDDRLIHGQVVEGWIPYLKVNHVVVVSEAAAADETQKLLMRIGLPESIGLEVLGVDAARARLLAESDPDKQVLVLAPSPREVLELMTGGLKAESVNVGGLHYSVGKVQLGRAIFLNQEDRDALLAIAGRGAQLDARGVPLDRRSNLLSLLKDGA